LGKKRGRPRLLYVAFMREIRRSQAGPWGKSRITKNSPFLNNARGSTNKSCGGGEGRAHGQGRFQSESLMEEVPAASASV